MSFQDRITEDVKEAMRGGETLRRDTLRMVLSALKNKRIEFGTSVEQSLGQALVGILKMCVLAHDGNGHALSGLKNTVYQLSPITEIGFLGLETE